jgi:hypothetical protein
MSFYVSWFAFCHLRNNGAAVDRTDCILFHIRRQPSAASVQTLLYTHFHCRDKFLSQLPIFSQPLQENRTCSSLSDFLRSP